LPSRSGVTSMIQWDPTGRREQKGVGRAKPCRTVSAHWLRG
jgi:hypothetical protein